MFVRRPVLAWRGAVLAMVVAVAENSAGAGAGTTGVGTGLKAYWVKKMPPLLLLLLLLISGDSPVFLKDSDCMNCDSFAHQVHRDRFLMQRSPFLASFLYYSL